MTTRYKTQAFIFKKSDINESDRLFSVFTNDFGRLDIFAKAIRKNGSKLRSGIDIFFMSDIEFVQGKNRKTLTDAIIAKKFGNIVEDLERFKIANDIGKVLDGFIKGEEKDNRIFNLLGEVFYRLDDKNLKIEKCALVYYYFLWNAFSILGYHPEVQKCNMCKQKINPDNIYFSGREGGIICGKCFEKSKSPQKINSDVVKVLRIIFKEDLETLLRLKIGSSSRKLLLAISEKTIQVFS